MCERAHGELCCPVLSNKLTYADHNLLASAPRGLHDSPGLAKTATRRVRGSPMLVFSAKAAEFAWR
jgi:hypothetical protein